MKFLHNMYLLHSIVLFYQLLLESVKLEQLSLGIMHSN